MRCYRHQGLPTAPPRQRKPQRRGQGAARRTAARTTGARRRTSAHRSQSPVTARRAAAQATVAAKRKKRVEDAAVFCAEVLTDGWQKTVENKAAEYVGKRTMQRLSRRRRIRRCKLLAKFAADVLAGKKWVHNVVGSFVRWVVSLLGGNWFVQILAKNIANKLPMPWDVKIIAVARGIQIVGVFLCIAGDQDLTRCQCFIDLAVEETKTRVKQILTAALDDWTELKNFPLRSRVSTTQ
jgi:hypothetical protein